MDWNPTEDMRLCQELAKKFAAEFLAPAQRRHEAGRALAPEVLAKFDELGLARIDWPVDDGGAGLGLLDRCVVLEALATADAGAVPAKSALTASGALALAFPVQLANAADSVSLERLNLIQYRPT